MDSKEPSILEKNVEDVIDKASEAEERRIVRKLDYIYVILFIEMVAFLQLGFLGSVVYIAAFVAQGVWYVGRYGNVHYTMSVTQAITCLGILILITIPLYKAKLVGLYISMLSGFVMTLIYSAITNNVAGKPIGPLLMVNSQKPLYIDGMIRYTVLDVVSILLLWICRHQMSKVNKKRLNNPNETCEKEDSTDTKNHNYIYKL